MARLLGLKVAVEINGVLIEGYQNKPKLHRYLTEKYKSILQKASFVAASKGYALLMKKYFGVAEEKLTYLTLGYHKLEHNHTRDESRRLLGLDLSINYLLFVGNVNKYQGLQYIIETIADYRHDFLQDNIRLIVVGDGAYLKDLQDMVVANDMETLITFKGRVDKATVQLYLSTDAIGLSPFDFARGDEGSISGLKTYDYLFHKMPIITSKMDDASDMILAKGFGDVIYDYTSEEIWTKVKTMVTDKRKNEIKDVYTSNYDWIVKTYNWSRRFSKISKSIEESLEQ